MSGSVSTVEAGQLTIMAGGDPEVLERARPVLDPLAKQVFHVGGLGSGAVMKLTVNSVLHGLNLALAEGLVLAERAGVARDTAYEVFAASAVAAPFVHYKREAFEHPGQTPVAFSLDLVEKDLDLILALAGETGAAMEQAATNRRVVQAAVAAGLGDHDLSELATYLRSAGQGAPDRPTRQGFCSPWRCRWPGGRRPRGRAGRRPAGRCRSPPPPRPGRPRRRPRPAAALVPLVVGQLDVLGHRLVPVLPAVVRAHRHVRLPAPNPTRSDACSMPRGPAETRPRVLSPDQCCN